MADEHGGGYRCGVDSFCGVGSEIRGIEMIMDTLCREYNRYGLDNNREPNIIIMGYSEKRELIRELVSARNIPLDVPPEDGTPMIVEGCLVVETPGRGARFAYAGDVFDVL